MSSPSAIFPHPCPLPQNVGTRTPFSARPLVLSPLCAPPPSPSLAGFLRVPLPPQPVARRRRGIWTRGWWLFLEAWRVVLPTPAAQRSPPFSLEHVGVGPTSAPGCTPGLPDRFHPQRSGWEDVRAPGERPADTWRGGVPRGWPVAPRSHRRCLDPVILDSPLPPEADATGHPKCKTGARPPVTWPGSGHTFSSLLALRRGPRLWLSG